MKNKYAIVYHDTAHHADVTDRFSRKADALRAYRKHLRDGGHPSTHSAVEILPGFEGRDRLDLRQQCVRHLEEVPA